MVINPPNPWPLLPSVLTPHQGLLELSEDACPAAPPGSEAQGTSMLVQDRLPPFSLQHYEHRGAKLILLRGKIIYSFLKRSSETETKKKKKKEAALTF